MKTTLIKTTLRGALAALLVLTFTPLLASGAGKIEGAWNVNVTVRNCATGQPVATVYRMLTFADDGVIQESAAFFNPLTPARRRISWKRTTSGAERTAAGSARPPGGSEVPMSHVTGGRRTDV